MIFLLANGQTEQWPLMYRPIFG
jgi:hypothetical protein